MLGVMFTSLLEPGRNQSKGSDKYVMYVYFKSCPLRNILYTVQYFKLQKFSKIKRKFINYRYIRKKNEIHLLQLKFFSKNVEKKKHTKFYVRYTKIRKDICKKCAQQMKTS